MSDIDECSICLELLDDKYQQYILKCGHKYHTTCLSEWYKNENSNYKCPQCNIPSEIININSSMISIPNLITTNEHKTKVNQQEDKNDANNNINNIQRYTNNTNTRINHINHYNQNIRYRTINNRRISNQSTNIVRSNNSRNYNQSINIARSNIIRPNINRSNTKKNCTIL